MSGKRQVDKYFEALKVLTERGLPISNDAVAIAAGSGRGSIKKSRPAHAELIAAIEAAADAQEEASRLQIDPSAALKTERDLLAKKLDQALERELCLLDELYALRLEVAQLKSRNARD